MRSTILFFFLLVWDKLWDKINRGWKGKARKFVKNDSDNSFFFSGLLNSTLLPGAIECRLVAGCLRFNHKRSDSDHVCARIYNMGCKSVKV